MNQISWIYLIHIMDILALSLVMPIFGKHLRDLGASYFFIGLLGSLNAAFELISGPIIGSWSDKSGRKRVLLYCLMGTALCHLFIGITNSVFVIFITRAIAGTLQHAPILNNAILADVVSTSENRLKYLGYLNAFSGLAFSIGPAISGNLSESPKGFYYTCLFAFVLCLLNIGITFRYLHDTKIVEKQKTEISTKPNSSNLFKDLKSAITSLSKIEWRLYWDIMILKFLSASIFSCFHWNYFVRVQNRFEISTKLTGYTISAQSLSATAAGFLSGNIHQLYQNRDYKTRNFHGYLFQSLTFLGLTLIPSFSAFIILVMLNKASSMILRITTSEMILKRCSPDKKGLIIGINKSVSNTARLITPVILGLFEDIYGTETGTVFATVLSCVATLVCTKIQSI